MGNTAQLPPVGGKTLWNRTSAANVSVDDNIGQQLYFDDFTTVVELTENNRLDMNDPDAIRYNGLLDRMADGGSLDDDWSLLKTNCSRDSMNQQEWENRGFNDADVTHLLPTNKDVMTFNYKALRNVNSPII